MIVLQLILFCALFTLMVKIAVGNNALNGLSFYPKPVQERAFEIGLTDPETVARKRKRFMMTKNFERITPADIDAICHACCHYDLRKLTDEEQKKLHLGFGDKDFDWLYSRKAVPVYMPNAELVLRHGYQHCGYMAAHPKEYAEEIEAFMRRPTI